MNNASSLGPYADEGSQNVGGTKNKNDKVIIKYTLSSFSKLHIFISKPQISLNRYNKFEWPQISKHQYFPTVSTQL